MNLLRALVIIISTSAYIAAQEIPNNVDLPSIAGIHATANRESPPVKSNVADGVGDEVSGIVMV